MRRAAVVLYASVARLKGARKKLPSIRLPLKRRTFKDPRTLRFIAYWCDEIKVFSSFDPLIKLMLGHG